MRNARAMSMCHLQGLLWSPHAISLRTDVATTLLRILVGSPEGDGDYLRWSTATAALQSVSRMRRRLGCQPSETCYWYQQMTIRYL